MHVEPVYFFSSWLAAAEAEVASTGPSYIIVEPPLASEQTHVKVFLHEPRVNKRIVTTRKTNCFFMLCGFWVVPTLLTAFRLVAVR